MWMSLIGLSLFILFVVNSMAELSDIGQNKFVTKDEIKDLIEVIKAKDDVINGLVEKSREFEAQIHVLTNIVNKQAPIVERVEAYENKIELLTELTNEQSSQILGLQKEVNELRGSSTGDDSNEGLDDETQTGSSGIIDGGVSLSETYGLARQGSIRKRHADDDLVAFFATLTKPLTHLGVGQNIRFDNVITNVMNAYNPHHGAFIAPVSGTYVFSVSLLSNYGHNSHFNFNKNGTAISNLYVAGSESNYDTASQTIIIFLDKGDDLAIQNVDANEEVDGYNYSTFSGFLLKQSFNNPAVVGK